MSNLSDAELKVIDHLRQAWNAFTSLPREHPDDIDEFRYSVHALQNIVLSRPARRENVERRS